MLHRRIFQFLIVYLLGVGLLFGLKFVLNLSDYVIPGPISVWQTGQVEFYRYTGDVLDTFAVAVIGQVLSILMAVGVGVGSAWPHPPARIRTAAIRTTTSANPMAIS